MIIGVDEAGRGALAGPVVVAAVAFSAEPPVDGEGPWPCRSPVAGLRDSKRLTPRRRSLLAEQLRAEAAYCVVEIAPEVIDRVNILQATLQGMAQAVAQLCARLGEPPREVRVDGNQLPAWSWPARAIPGGDDLEPAIMAASILAKVQRDSRMVALDGDHRGYGFALHKGYPTAAHRRALCELGPSAVHRHSFAPVAATLRQHGAAADGARAGVAP